MGDSVEGCTQQSDINFGTNADVHVAADLGDSDGIHPGIDAGVGQHLLEEKAPREGVALDDGYGTDSDANSSTDYAAAAALAAAEAAEATQCLAQAQAAVAATVAAYFVFVAEVAANQADADDSETDSDTDSVDTPGTVGKGVLRRRRFRQRSSRTLFPRACCTGWASNGLLGLCSNLIESLDVLLFSDDSGCDLVIRAAAFLTCQAGSLAATSGRVSVLLRQEARQLLSSTRRAAVQHFRTRIVRFRDVGGGSFWL